MALISSYAVIEYRRDARQALQGSRPLDWSFTHTNTHRRAKSTPWAQTQTWTRRGGSLQSFGSEHLEERKPLQRRLIPSIISSASTQNPTSRSIAGSEPETASARKRLSAPCTRRAWQVQPLLHRASLLPPTSTGRANHRPSVPVSARRKIRSRTN